MKVALLILCLLLSACAIPAALKNDSRVQVLKVAEGSYLITRMPDVQTGFATGVTSSAEITAWSPPSACVREQTRIIAATKKAVRCSAISFTLDTFGTLHVFLTNK